MHAPESPGPKEYRALTDEELMRGFQDGDEECFTELHRRFHVLVCHWAAQVVPNYDTVAEVAQETFLSVFRFAHQYDGRSFQGWLKAIALNHARTRKKRDGGRPHAISLSASEKMKVHEPESKEKEPVDGLIDDERRAFQERVFQTIPEIEDGEMLLEKLAGRKALAIASERGLKEGAFYVRLHRARKRIRDRFRDVIGTGSRG